MKINPWSSILDTASILSCLMDHIPQLPHLCLQQVETHSYTHISNFPSLGRLITISWFLLAYHTLIHRLQFLSQSSPIWQVLTSKLIACFLDQELVILLWDLLVEETFLYHLVPLTFMNPNKDSMDQDLVESGQIAQNPQKGRGL